MDRFNLLLDLCRLLFKEVDSSSAGEAAKFQRVTIVRSIDCSCKTPELQELAVSSTDFTEFLQCFSNSGEEKFNSQLPETKLLTALMPKDNVNELDTWSSKAIVCHGLVHEPVLLLATANCLTGSHADTNPPTEVVASLLCSQKLWIFAISDFKEAANLLKKATCQPPSVFHRRHGLPSLQTFTLLLPRNRWYCIFPGSYCTFCIQCG